MSNGKDYEIFVLKLQQALINSDKVFSQKNIIIERNVILKDRFDIDREFDLYWEYEFAGVIYKTIIECKDYASRVSVDKIDALIGKLEDFPDIKPIFATKTGYQSGAEAKAKAHKIDLLVVREQNGKDWLDDEGNELIKEISIEINVISQPRATSIKPYISKEWLLENPSVNVGAISEINTLDNNISIEYNNTNEIVNLNDALNEMTAKIEGFGEVILTECFEDAYLHIDNTKLLLKKMDITYYTPSIIKRIIHINIAHELIGVIEYLHRGTSTAIFKDRIIEQWRTI